MPQSTKRIVVSEVFPPIPTTEFDYCAFYEGEEERREYGWGASSREAIENLEELFSTGFYPNKPYDYMVN